MNSGSRKGYPAATRALTGARAWVLLILTSLMLAPGVSFGQIVEEPPDPPASLKTAPIPRPSNLAEFVRDEAAAVRLGKALFWDMQAGSDGVQACASCHFHAGADNRAKNQINPGILHGSVVFDKGSPNHALSALDFPFRKLSDPDRRPAQGSIILSDSDDVVSSQGVTWLRFVDVVPGNFLELGTSQEDPVFQVGGVGARRVEPRNTPTVINAVFNFRNFLDGRANHFFNGASPFGPQDPDAQVFKVVQAEVQPVQVLIDNASLASQAVGPPGSDFEMSFIGRSFPKIGKKMLSLRPLARQKVHPNDSVLGPLAGSRIDPEATGLEASYSEMIRAAFQPEWWDSEKIVSFDGAGSATVAGRPDRPLTTGEFTLAEANFSLFWGLAIQLYETTLVANDTALDRFLEGDTSALTAQQQEGLDIFSNRGRCVECHGGPELTDASTRNIANQPIERMVMGDGGIAVYDSGFYNIGVRPTSEDIGVGGTDPFGNPLSFTRLAQTGVTIGFELDPPIDPNERTAVDGSIKTPGLRNVELTAPYFHNGGQGTLRQVVEFYTRGGDFHEENIDNLDPDIDNIGGMDDVRKEALVAFLRSLTDERVRLQQAPFDHPEICVPNGHPGDDEQVTDDGTGKATDGLISVPAVGAAGGPALQPFLASVSAVPGTCTPRAAAVTTTTEAPAPGATGSTTTTAPAPSAATTTVPGVTTTTVAAAQAPSPARPAFRVLSVTAPDIVQIESDVSVLPLGGVLRLLEVFVRPNPFTPNGDGDNDFTRIHFTIDRPASLTLEIFSFQRRERVLASDVQLPAGGSYAALWTGTDQNGKVLPTGNYRFLLRLAAGGSQRTFAGIARIESNVSFQAFFLKRVLQLAGGQASPSPFTPNGEGDDDHTGISFTLDRPALVTIEIFSDRAREKLLTRNQRFPAGTSAVGWTGTDDQGKVLPEGDYRFLIKAAAGGVQRTFTGTVRLSGSGL